MFYLSEHTSHEDALGSPFAARPDGTMAYVEPGDDVRRVGLLPPALEEILRRRLADPYVLEARIYCWGGAVLREHDRGGRDLGVRIEVVPLRMWSRLGEERSYQIVTRDDLQRSALAQARACFGRLPGDTTLAYGGPNRDVLGHCLISLITFAPTPDRGGWIDRLLGGPAMADLLRSVERSATLPPAPARALSEVRLGVAA
jgi:hypothetical protein